MTPHPRRSPVRLRVIGSSRAARALFGVLASIGFLVGVARTAKPTVGHLFADLSHVSAGDPSSNTVGDDPGPSVNEARLPRSGIRRAVVVFVTGLPDDRHGPLGGRTRLVQPTHDGLPPSNFVPSPPFHPPRAS